MHYDFVNARLNLQRVENVLGRLVDIADWGEFNPRLYGLLLIALYDWVTH